MRVWLVIPLLLVGARAATADPPAVPPKPASPSAKPAPSATPEQVADAVLAAIKATDNAALNALAAKDDPDPWLVADELLARGRHAAAAAFSTAAASGRSRSAAGGLERYVSSRSGRVDDAADRAALGRPEPAAPVGDSAAVSATVVGARLAFARGERSTAVHRHDEAVAAFSKAGEVADAIGWTRMAADAADNESLAARDGGDLARAGSAATRWVVLEERLGRRWGAGRALRRLADVRRGEGRLAESIELAERALKIAQETSDDGAAVGALVALGIANFGLARYAAAGDFFERALASYEQRGDREGAAAVLGNLGNVQLGVGDPSRAIEFYERALAENEALGRRASAALVLGNLGRAYAALGDLDRALDTTKEALARKEALGDRVGAAVTLGNIGNDYNALGQYALAITYHERALAAHESLGDVQSAANSLVSLGMDRLGLRRPAEARPFLERGLARARQVHGDETRVYACNGLADACLALGDVPAAADAAREGLTALRAMCAGLDDGARAALVARFPEFLSHGAGAAERAGDAVLIAEFIEIRRSPSLAAQILGRPRSPSASDARAAAASLAKAKGRESVALAAYARAVDSSDESAVWAAAEALSAARAERRDAEARARRAAIGAAEPVRALSLDVQRCLAPDETLVVLTMSADAASALRITREGRTVIAIGSSAEVEAAAADAAAACGSAASDPGSALARLRSLRAALAPDGAPTGALSIVAEGPLGRIPFAALLPDHPVAIVPSLAVFGALRAANDETARGEGVLAFGAPEVNAHVLGSPTAAPMSPARAGSREETTAVGDVRRLGAEATERALRDALASHPQWRSLHLACPVLSDDERPARTAIALTPAGSDDGRLRALEISTIQLTSDLVVLSADESGGARRTAGEGALTRAFMFAGAPRVICSLWKVDDEATRALMVKFYKLWNPKDGKPGLPTAEALRKAQEFVRSQKKWEHPYYWAGWVLWGLPS